MKHGKQQAHQADEPESDWLAQYYTRSRETLGADRPEEPDEPQGAGPMASGNAKYDLADELGSGAMKVVRRAHDRNAERDVAMALLREPSARVARANRFLREARITAALEHPNIVPVHEVGEDAAGRPYFTMKLLGGESLHSILKRLAEGDADYIRRYPLNRLLRIFQGICNAVAFAHSRGVIHLDLKPANVQVDSFGAVLVLDWGLAKVMDGVWPGAPGLAALREARAEGGVHGTPGYMAPEQTRGDYAALDPRTDVYALGAVLYAILTWQTPAASTDTDQVLADTREGALAPPSQRAPDRKIPPALDAIALKAMATDPANRYQNANDLWRDMQSFLDGYATLAENAGLLTQIRLLISRHRTVFSLIGVSLLTILTIVTISFFRIANSERAATAALERLKIEQASKRRIGLLAAPQVLEQAQEYLRKLEIDEALQQLDFCLALDDGYAEARIKRGCFSLGRLEFDSALAFLDRVGRSDGNGTSDEQVRSAVAALEKITRDYRSVVQTNGGALPVAQQIRMTADVYRLNDISLLLRQCSQIILTVFFQRQNSQVGPVSPTFELTREALRIMNPAAGENISLQVMPTADGLAVLVRGARVENFLALAGLPIVTLDLAGTAVSDLNWVRHMPLIRLDLSETGINDLRPLVEIRTLVELRLVRCRGRGYMDSVPFMPQLEKIIVAKADVASVERFLERYNLRRPPQVIGE